MGTLSNIYEINGVIDTSRSVLDNMNTICNAAGCWLSFDITTGLWSVIINKPGTAIKNFNDSNIIGNINVSGTGISEAYNSVLVEFPHKDLRDSIDYVQMTIPEADRYPNELDNVLNISLQCINNPVQAQFVGVVELKQSRVDKVIEFRTDYRALGLKAGDLISVTNNMYGYTDKVFRITKITESDNDDGNIELAITGLEYDENIYTDDGLVFEEKTKKTGIVPKSQNQVLTAEESKALTTKNNVVQMVYSFFVSSVVLTGDNVFHTVDLGYNLDLPYDGFYKVNYQVNWASNVTSTPPLGISKQSGIVLTKDGSPVTLGDWAFTGDDYAPLYEDHTLDGFFTATAGENLHFFLEYRTNFPDTYTTPVGYPTYTPPVGAVAAVWISAELLYLPPRAA